MAVRTLTQRRSDGRQRELPNIRRAYGYCRVSTDQQRESGISLGDQQRRIEAYAVVEG